MPGEDEGRDQGGEAEAKEQQRWPAKPEKLGDRHGTDASSQPSEETNPGNILISDF